MTPMLKNEIIKLITNKVFIFCVVAALTLNLAILYVKEEKTRVGISVTASEYSALVNRLDGMGSDEKLSYLQKKMELVAAAMRDLSNDFEDTTPDYSGDAEPVEFTRNVFAERALLMEVTEEVEGAEGYQTMVATVLKNTDRSLKKAEEGSYDYQRLMNIKTKYERLMDVSPVMVPQRAASLVFDNRVTDILMIIAILCMSIVLISFERENRIIALPKITKNGRSIHGAVKLATVIIVGTVFSVIVTVENLLLSAAMYGGMDLSAPVQGVLFLRHCTFKISLGQYLLLFIGMKSLFWIMCGTFFFLLCAAIRRSSMVYIIAFSVTAVLLTGFQRIEYTSHLVMLKYFNPVAFGMVKELTERLVYVNLWGNAVSWFTLALMLEGILIVLMGAGAVAVYANIPEKEIRRASRTLFPRLDGYHTGIFAHEMYKIFIAGRTVLIVAAGAFLAWILFVKVETNPMDSKGAYYKMYCSEFAGEYTEETEKTIMAYRLGAERALEQPNLSEAAMRSINDNIEVLDELLAHGEYLMSKGGGLLFWDEGYQKITGGDYDTNEHDKMLLIVFSLFIILSFCMIMAIDCKGMEYRIVRCSVGGKKHFVSNKVIVGGLVIIAMWCAYFLPEIIGIIRVYGTEYMGTSAADMEFLKWVPGFVTIGAYVALRNVALLIAGFAVMALCYAVTYRQRNYVVSVLICSFVVIVPQAVALIV